MEIVVPHTLRPEIIQAPASKSLAQRFILASALASEPTTLFNTGQSADVLHMLEVAQKLGAAIHSSENSVVITPSVTIASSLFNSGESGLGARLLMPVLTAIGGRFTIKGQGSLNKRPMTEMVRFFLRNGILVYSDDEFLPITLDGKLRGGKFQIDGSKSSQYISGLLMALPLCETDSELYVTDLSSKSYVDLTLYVLNRFGIRIQHENYQKFLIPGNQKYIPKTDSFSIEGDYSGAANWIVAGAIADQPVQLTGLTINSLQGDALILDLAKKAGACVEWNGDKLIVSKRKNLPFEADASDVPDLFPPLVVLAAAACGTSRISGIHRLIHKESNRAQVLQTEFNNLGLKITFSGDDMLVEGTGKLTPGIIHSNNDHRIAMSGAIAAFLTTGSVTIRDAGSVSKSYPDFWAHCGIN